MLKMGQYIIIYEDGSKETYECDTMELAEAYATTQAIWSSITYVWGS